MVQIISNVSPMSNSESSLPIKPPHGQQVHTTPLNNKEFPAPQSSSLPLSQHSVGPSGQISGQNYPGMHQPVPNMQRTQYQPGPPIPGSIPPHQGQMPPGQLSQFNSMAMSNQKSSGNSPSPNSLMGQQYIPPSHPGQKSTSNTTMSGSNISQNKIPPPMHMMPNQHYPASSPNQISGPLVSQSPQIMSNSPIGAPQQVRPPLHIPQNMSMSGAQPNNMSGPPLSNVSSPSMSIPTNAPPQNLSGPPLPNVMSQSIPGQNMAGPPLLGGPSPNNMTGSLLSSGPPQNNILAPQLPGGPGQNSMSGQNMTGPNMSGPPLPNVPSSNNMLGPNMSAPPVSSQNSMSGLPISGSQSTFSGQSNMSSPPLPGQHMNSMSGYQKPPSASLQNSMAAMSLSGPDQQNSLTGPPTSQSGMYSSNLSGPPLPRQPNNNMPGQQDISGPNFGQGIGMPPRQMTGQPPLQPHLTAQGPPGNYMTGPRQFPQGSSIPDQGMGPNPIHQQPMPTYQQGYQQRPPQQMYPQNAQQNTYNQQRSPYPDSGPGGYQSGMQQQPRRLNPDQMPSPIQVIQDDQAARGGEFVTNQKGLVPPLVTTKFVVQDQGNASPRYIRSTIYTVPTSSDILKQSHVPFGLILSPMARAEPGEYEPMIVNMGPIGPVRCVRCKAYMCPFMQFIDGGRRFQCMFCKVTTEVPAEYFQHLDHTGQRLDRHERPELMLGTYEYLATQDYCRNNTFPKPPAIVFVIDVSYNNIKSGLVNLICGRMKEIIRNLPVDVGQEKSNMKVGFITYNNTVHFYNIKQCLAQPQMMIVGDVQDIFMPLLDGFLCDPEESEVVIDSLMVQIPTMFAETRETETILAPAIQAGLEALKASECVGKLMVFHSSLPIAEAPGKLKNRDDRKLLGTDKEKNVLAPQNNVYNNLGQDCVNAGCSVDLFLFNNSFIDVPTIGQVCRLTGGQVYKYTYFQADIDGGRFITDIIKNIRRPVAFDSVMRIRTSTGVRATDFYGHFFMSNTTDMDIASIDCDKAVAVEIKHDDKLTEDEGVYIQVALLYTSCGGIRRLRIINLGLKTSSQLAELYRACELDAIMNFFAKQSVFKLTDSTPKAVKGSLIARCANMLAAYRKNCASSPSGSGQLILPECMKLLPLYVNCLIKSDALSGGPDMTIDDRAFIMQAVCFMTVKSSVTFLYPRLISLHDVDAQETHIPPMKRCSIDKFTEDGAFLLENGIHMFLWLGSTLSPSWVQSVFGSPSVTHIDTNQTTIPVLDNPLNKRIHDIIARIRSERDYCMRLTLVRQRDKIEMVLRHFLVEDRDNDGSSSYVDFLCHMHKEIKTILS